MLPRQFDKRNNAQSRRARAANNIAAIQRQIPAQATPGHDCGNVNSCYIHNKPPFYGVYKFLSIPPIGLPG
jgi:hypothetical protein